MKKIGMMSMQLIMKYFCMNVVETLPVAQLLEQVLGLFLLISNIEWLGLHERNPYVIY
jgi:hypothetical protein